MRPKARFHVLMAMIVGLVFAARGAEASTIIPIVNGDFESPLVGGGFVTYSGPSNSSSLTGWTIDGSIDHIGTYWQPANGNQSLDMNGNDTGTISQNVDIPFGLDSASVSFSLAGNPDNAPVVKTLQVSLIGLGGSSQSYTFDTSGKTHLSMGWISETAVFAVVSPGTYTLQFQSLDSGSWGPALDNVSMSASTSASVPDGGMTLVLLGLSITGFAFLRHKMV